MPFSTVNFRTKRILSPCIFTFVEYYFIKGHKDFLNRLLKNDKGRTPLTQNDKYVINKCLLRGFYTTDERPLFIELRRKYKDHVCGTKI